MAHQATIQHKGRRCLQPRCGPTLPLSMRPPYAAPYSAPTCRPPVPLSSSAAARAKHAVGIPTTDGPAAPQDGLIAGGLADGTVCAWDPGALMSPEAQDGRELAPLTSMPKHTSAVRGLDFNPLSSNLLASAGEDGQVCIWDLAVPDSPKLYPPMVRIKS